MDEFTKEDRDLICEQFVPVVRYLGEEITDWHCREQTFKSDKVKQVYISQHTHNLPVESHAYLFRWLMPARPFLYSHTDGVEEAARYVGIFRYTIGTERLTLTEKEIHDIAKGIVAVDKQSLTKLNELAEKTFKFNAYKTPIFQVRIDVIPDSAFDQLYEIHNGSLSQEVSKIQSDFRRKQESEKEKLLLDVKGKLKAQPDYLSILRDIVSGRLSIDEATERTFSSLFIKGV